jgi:murein DD-endopeptidase MepM/ murein hydrolase activator NlpD
LRIRNQTPGSRRRKRGLALSGILLIGLSLAIYAFIIRSGPVLPPTEQQAQSGSASTKTQPQEPPHQVIEGSVKEGSTFSKSLSRKNIPREWIELLISKLKPYINFKKIKGGTYRFIADSKGELVQFIYEVTPTDVYEVEKGTHDYAARKREVPLDTYLVKVVGEIRSSLFDAFDAAGEQDQLVMAFAEILASEIDFYKDVREGDRFKVIVEKVYKEDDFIRYGPIHAVEYERGERSIKGFSYHGAFYNEKGLSLRKAFLKVPLRFNRISSRFSRARKHPILGGVRPHYGVDYAAPTGTPIWAVADGAVTSCGWGAGFGNQVILRHANGYMTCYGHLSAFGPKIRKGTTVKQMQIIGYVGSTGLSTGPHLDYRLMKDGRFKNPLKETFPAGLPIGKGEMEGFQKRRDGIITLLQGDTPLKKRAGQDEKIDEMARERTENGGKEKDPDRRR